MNETLVAEVSANWSRSWSALEALEGALLERAAAFSEMHRVIQDIEAALSAAYAPDKMNYLMLMMVDPHVHYHVIPRYGAERPEADPGWPGPPALASAADVSVEEVRATLIAAWPLTRDQS